jgi:hypothetical protein
MCELSSPARANVVMVVVVTAGTTPAMICVWKKGFR